MISQGIKLPLWPQLFILVGNLHAMALESAIFYTKYWNKKPFKTSPKQANILTTGTE